MQIAAVLVVLNLSPETLGRRLRLPLLALFGLETLFSPVQPLNFLAVFSL